MELEKFNFELASGGNSMLTYGVTLRKQQAHFQCGLSVAKGKKFVLKFLMASQIVVAFILPVVVIGFQFNETKKFHEKIFKNKENPYDRRIRPFAGEKELEVEIFLRVLSLRSVSETTMDYKIELYFREYWHDPRLAYDASLYENVSHISLHESLAEELWTPDTYFPNAIKSRSPNSNSITHRSLIRVELDGHVLYSRRLSVTAECPMSLMSYPFDRQVCILSVESYGHRVSEVKYIWKKLNPVNLDPHLELPEFELTNVKTMERIVSLLTGNYTRLECCFFFKRNAGFYFVQLFLPATAIVVTSWLLLCMERTSKFSDMIEVVLAITLLYYSYITVMPRVSYIKALDIYLGSCFIFVFISLIKLYTLKLNRWKNGNRTIEDDEEEDSNLEHTRKKKGRKCEHCGGMRVPLARFDSSDGENEMTIEDKHRKERSRKENGAVRRVSDEENTYIRAFGMRHILRYVLNFFSESLMIYPIVFICFSVLYFAYFLVLASDQSEWKCKFPD